MAEKCSFSEKFRVWALACYINAGGDPTKPYDTVIATKAFTNVFNNVNQAVEEFGKMMPEANKDLASGLYMITGQTDTVSGSGCRTTLSLVRVGK